MKKLLLLVTLFLIGLLIGQYLTKEKDISTTTYEEKPSHDFELTYPTKPTCEYILAQEGILV